MNKKFSAFVSSIVSLFLLVACSNPESNQNTANSVQESSVGVTASESSSSTIASSTPTQETSQPSAQEVGVASVYRPVIENYAHFLVNQVAANPEEISGQISLLTQYPERYKGPYYSQYDVEKDGEEELFIALEKEGTYFLIDLYTQLAGGDSVRLTESLNQSGLEIGEEVLLWALEDGTYSVDQSGNFSIYRYDNHIPGLKKISDTAPSVASIDLRQLAWAPISP